MVDHNCFLWMLVCLSLLLSNHNYNVGSAASTIIHQPHVKSMNERNESRDQETARHQFGVYYEYQHLATENEDIVITEETEIETIDGKISFERKSGSRCLTEKGLDLYGGTFVMAPTETFTRESFGQCLHFCMTHAPAQSHLLISYYNALLIGDKFNCMCSDEENLSNTTELSDVKCDVQCPYSSYKCGDAKEDFLSAYCLKRGCKESDLAANEPICARRLPHDIHGCIKHDFVDWSRSHNARNFTAALEGDSACIWECRDNHMGAIFALTRIVGAVRTCSCGFPGSFDLNKMVDPEFCQIFKEEHGIKKDHDYYNVNCVTDLDDGGSTIPEDGGGRCDSVGPVGCIYSDLVPSQLQNQFSIQVSDSEDFPDVTKCLLGCRAIFPGAFFAGVRSMPALDNVTNELECSCLQPHAFNSSTLGPSANCNQFCGPPSLGLLCGNDPKNSKHTSLSLYCLAGGEKSSLTSTKSGQIRAMPTNHDQNTGIHNSGLLRQTGLNSSDISLMPILQGIDKSVSKQRLTTEVMVGLLTLLCIILVSIVVYLCYTRGISSLSRYVM